MKKSRTIEEDGLIVTYFGGLHTFNDAKSALDELLDINKGLSQIYEIVVNDDDLVLKFERHEEELLYQRVKETYENFEFGALAIVAKSDVVFGLSRVLELTIENHRIAISVFRTINLARAWIKEIREIHNEHTVANR